MKNLRFVSLLALVATLAQLTSPSANAALKGIPFSPEADARFDVLERAPAITGDASIAGNLAVTGTTALTGVATLTAAPVMSALTASLPVFTGAGKALASNAMTGTGSVVMSAGPTMTGTIGAASMTLSGTLGVTGTHTAGAINASGAFTSSVAGVGIDLTSANAGAANTIRSVNSSASAESAGQIIAAGSSGNFRIKAFGAGGNSGAEILTGGLSGGGTVNLFTDYATGRMSIGANGIAAINISATGHTTITNQLIIEETASPGAADACTAGRIVWDTGFIYICVVSGGWERVAIAGGY
jgi:hypothetical protein